MKEKLIGIGALLILILLLGGWGIFAEALGVLGQVFIGFFPAFFDVVKKPIEDYLSSPYFIVGLIMSIASGFGIYFGAKGGKILFLVVSIILELISIASIVMNLA